MSVINWFEVPVADFERAKAFYETVMETQLFVNDQRETMGSMLGVFPHDGNVGGCLVHNPQDGYTPSAEGTLVYFTVTGDLDKALGRVADAGGEVLLPKTPCPKMPVAVSSAGSAIPKAIRSDSIPKNRSSRKTRQCARACACSGASPSDAVSRAASRARY